MGLMLSAIALAALLHWGPAPADVWRVASAIPVWGWLLAGLGMAFSYCLRALRLHSEWHAVVGISRRECLRVAVLHTAAILVLPMRSGEASFPFLLKRRWKVPLLQAALSLLWMRIQDICIVTLFVLFAFTTGPVLLRLGAIVAFACLAASAWHRLRQRCGMGERAPPPADGLGRGLRQQLRRLAGNMPAALSQSRGGGRSWLFCGLIWLTKFSVLVLLLLHLTRLPVADGLRGVLGGEFAAALPLQPALGAGTYEAGVVFGAAYSSGAAGANASVTLSAAIAIHLFMLAISFLAAALAVLTDRGARLVETMARADGEAKSKADSRAWKYRRE